MQSANVAAAWWIRLSCAAVLLAAASDLSAQATAPEPQTVRVRGRVVDSAGVAVPQAFVGIAPGGQVRTSDGQGRFEFVLPAAGTYTLRARAVGHAPATLAVTLAAGETREVVLRANRFPVTLSTVEIHAARHSKHLAGILRRRSVGLGDVLFAEDLARYNYVDTWQALRNPRILQKLPPRRTPSSRSIIRRCSEPLVYIDGQRRGARRMPQLKDVEAIEVHRSIDFLKNAADFSYSDLGSRCPVIMIWSKTGLADRAP